MKINDLFKSEESIACVPARVITPDSPQGVPGETCVQMEHVLDVYVNDVATMTMTCSPDHLPELVLGRMFSEGMIRGAEEVDIIYVCDQGVRARVYLDDRQADFSKRQVDQIPTCCTGTQTLNAYFKVADELEKVQPISWNPQWIFDLSALLVTDTPMHKVTFGVHSCFLSRNGEVLYCCEDLGRHNAFDKIIGCALRDGVDLTQCIVYSSGRLPVDMVTKAIRAGIPVLASKAVPTERTIQIAKDHDLTLICSAHPDKMLVLNDPKD